MKRRERGITLIEVLVAVTLLSLLAVGMLFAMRVGVNAWGKANDRLASNRRVSGARRALDAQIAGLMPVWMHCPTGTPGRFARLLFFQGEPQSMRFASSYSLQEAWRGRPQILEFTVVPRPEGGVRLIVNEIPYTGPEGAGAACLGIPAAPGGLPRPLFRPVEAGPQSFVLADRLAFCRFSYLEELPPPSGPRWRTDWLPQRWPLAIRIEMGSLDAADSANLHPTTFTAPVRVRRLPEIVYADE